MNVTFRLRKMVKYQGMAYSTLFLAALIGCISIFFLEEPAKHGFKDAQSVARVGGLGVVVSSTMLILSIYTWLSYYVERFRFDGTLLSIRSMLQNRQFDVSEIECVRWKVYPIGGRIRFRVYGSRACLDLHGYSRSDRLRIIRALRNLVPVNKQQDWPMFCHKVAVPLRDGVPAVVRSDPSAEWCTINRRRYDRMLVICLPLSVALAVFVWWAFNLWQFLALPFLAVIAWVLLRYDVPQEGRAKKRLTSTSQGRAQLIGCVAVVSSQLLMVGLSLMGFGKLIACGTACVVLTLTCPPIMYLSLKSERHRKALDNQASQLAPTIWQEGEMKERTGS